jgi:adrenodoxin-NADP+ reductase
MHFNLDGPSHIDGNGKRALIIGQGNVALDVGRILLTPLALLSKTDMPQYAYDALVKSNVHHARIIGRRGPVQAAFTNKELREIMNIPGVAFRADFAFPESKGLPRPQNRMIDLLRRHQTVEGVERTVSLEFCLKPRRFVTGKGNRVVGMEFIRQALVNPRDPKSAVIELAEEIPVIIEADMVFTSIGYSSVPLRGMSALGVDLIRGVLPNDSGRVKAISTTNFELETSGDARMERVDGVYAAGWVKTGPTGVIASTMYSSFETGDSLVQDWNEGKPFLQPDADQKGWGGFKQEVEKVGVHPVEWNEWKKIEEEETKRGEPLGKEREKVVDTRQMLDLAGHVSS